jgi:hypothetical protein
MPRRARRLPSLSALFATAFALVALALWAVQGE